MILSIFIKFFDENAKKSAEPSIEATKDEIVNTHHNSEFVNPQGVRFESTSNSSSPSNSPRGSLPSIHRLYNSTIEYK
jgi:hypothetical protein